ncbi:hypothetical protein FRZ44_06430 [Hypericibacter terrae]|jgi:hypothetical protein|uniref:Uncharacterized protein n=2 Tax=Hypericibacter terrae TaxID=2602015 RepID=A0A5J6MGH7_9PROT|nr:hypothetical protein FRZ44_06430 [Hypericibacter terrae]
MFATGISMLRTAAVKTAIAGGMGLFAARIANGLMPAVAHGNGRIHGHFRAWASDGVTAM